MNKLYENIRERRKALGMTQQELAEKIGYMDRSMVAKIENGTVDISQSKIVQIAKALETTPSDLMGEVEWYDDKTVQMITDKLRKNPEYSVLFKAASNVKREDIDLVRRLIEKFSD